jgi:hypothetical protein
MRTVIWYVYKRLATSLLVRTGLYKFYLDVDMPSHKIYRHAINVTDNLKGKEVEARLAERRRKREAEDGRNKLKEQQTAAAKGGGAAGRSNGLARESNGASAPGEHSSRSWNGAGGGHIKDVESAREP